MGSGQCNRRYFVSDFRLLVEGHGAVARSGHDATCFDGSSFNGSLN